MASVKGSKTRLVHRPALTAQQWMEKLYDGCHPPVAKVHLTLIFRSAQEAQMSGSVQLTWVPVLRDGSTLTGELKDADLTTFPLLPTGDRLYAYFHATILPKLRAKEN